MKRLIIFTATILLSTQVAWAKKCTLTQTDINNAQKAWAEGVVAIGAAKDPKQRAIQHLDNLYGYGESKVLFKPTKAIAVQFRRSKEEALSYFVKGIVSEDIGFALAAYTNVRFENYDTIINCDSALAMGNYYFTTTAGKEVKAEYSFGYFKDKEGNVKINLHHSSMPYSK